ncbi:MAG: hypothetical protein RI897_4498, partial [Verrucomicrobiota bacterium]
DAEWVPGEEDDSHAAAAELLEDFEAVEFGECSDFLGWGDLPVVEEGFPAVFAA